MLFVARMLRILDLSYSLGRITKGFLSINDFTCLVPIFDPVDATDDLFGHFDLQRGTSVLEVSAFLTKGEAQSPFNGRIDYGCRRSLSLPSSHLKKPRLSVL